MSNSKLFDIKYRKSNFGICEHDSLSTNRTITIAQLIAVAQIDDCLGRLHRQHDRNDICGGARNENAGRVKLGVAAVRPVEREGGMVADFRSNVG